MVLCTHASSLFRMSAICAIFWLLSGHVCARLMSACSFASSPTLFRVWKSLELFFRAFVGIIDFFGKTLDHCQFKGRLYSGYVLGACHSSPGNVRCMANEGNPILLFPFIHATPRIHNGILQQLNPCNISFRGLKLFLKPVMPQPLIRGGSREYQARGNV